MGTWSTGRVLTTGGVLDDASPRSVMWQIEHNGSWEWEISEQPPRSRVILSGPTDLTPVDAAGAPRRIVRDRSRRHRRRRPEARAAVAALTAYRRALAAATGTACPLVFNDYMNTLIGDPDDARSCSPVDAAAAVGAESSASTPAGTTTAASWWDSVGEWQPSTTRFPSGLGEVTRPDPRRGMVARALAGARGHRRPAARWPRASRRGVPPARRRARVEHGRFHLDLRHPAARAHLDGVVDRLVDDFGVGFFKLDYNINPGPEPTSAAKRRRRPARAQPCLLAWLDGVLDRHPDLSSRTAPPAPCARTMRCSPGSHLQSTSDQQDPVLYAADRGGAPVSMFPSRRPTGRTRSRR